MAIQRSTLVTKAQELMNTEKLDYATAAKRAKEAMTTTTPVQQVPVTPAPVVPTPAPVTPTPIVNAPVDQTTELSKPLEPVAQPVQQVPVTPTPVQAEVKAPEVKPVVASQKTEAPVDYTQAQGREQEIMTNLEKFKTQGMTPDQIKNASGYNQATPEKKAIIEGFLNPVKQDAGTIFSTLRAGGSVPTSDTPEYRQAQARFNTFKRFSTYDVASLSTAMQEGTLLMGTQAYNDVISDPNMLAKIQKAKIFMNGEINIDSVGKAQGQYVMTQNPSVANALADGNMSQEEYNSLTNNAEVQTQAKVVSEARKKYDEYKRQLEAISDTVDEEYKTDNDIFKNAVKSNLDKSIRRLYNSASDDLQNALGTYTELKNSSTALLEINMKQYEQKQADARQIAQEQRQMQSQKDLIQYKSDFEKQQAEQALNDPATQIGQTMAEFEKMGITSQGSLASKIAEFKQSGLSLPEYVNNLRKLYMAKPEYQKLQELESGKLSDAQKFQMQNAVEDRRDLRNFAQQKELAKFNNDLNRQEFLFKIENDPAQKAKTLELEKQLNSNKSLFDVLGKNVGTYEGNRGYDLAGNLGDPLPAGGNWKVKSVDTAGEQVGSIFIGGKGKKPYGNTVVMQDENGNEIRYSHLQNIGVKPGDILGFGDIVGTRGNTGNVKGANGETLTAEQLKAGRGAHVDIEIKDKSGKLLSNSDQVNFLKGLKAGGEYSEPDITIFNSMSPTDKKKSQNDPAYRSFLADYNKTMKDKNAPLEDILKYSAGQNKMGDAESKSLDKFSQALGQISGIQEQISKMDTGPIIGRLRNMNPYDTDAQVLKAQLQALIPNIARGVYGEVGVLTDADIANYAKTIPNLTSTNDVNNAILAMTLQTMGTGYKSQLQSLASAKNDVSGYGGLYNQYMDIVNQLKSQNTGATQANTTLSITPEQKSKFDALYSRIQK